MDAKTQDAAGETGVQVGRWQYWARACKPSTMMLPEEPVCRLCRAVRPALATPRETAIAAPTGALDDVDVVQNYVVKTVKTVSDRADALIALGRIRDALLAARSLTAPAAQEGDPESDEAFFARIHARRKARQAQTFAEENQ